MTEDSENVPTTVTDEKEYREAIQQLKEEHTVLEGLLSTIGKETDEKLLVVARKNASQTASNLIKMKKQVSDSFIGRMPPEGRTTLDNVEKLLRDAYLKYNVEISKILQ